jgi:hypothetical protein
MVFANVIRILIKKKKRKKKHQTHGMSGKGSDLDGSLSLQL